MGLRLIYGRAGSGKSNFCFNEISNIIKESNKIYMITPEQFSYMQERKMLDILKENAVINAEVLTFARMAYRVLQEERRSIKHKPFKIWKGNAYLLHITRAKKEFNILK
jgi:ATP-dependent helicase/nuclease subunit B